MALWGKNDFKTITDSAGNDSEVTAVSGNRITVTTIAKDEPYELKVGDCVYINMHMFGSPHSLPSAGICAGITPNGSNWDVVLEANGKTWGYIPERNHNNESGMGFESGHATLQDWSNSLANYGASGGILWNAGGNNSNTGAKIGKVEAPKFLRNYLLTRWQRYTTDNKQIAHTETSDKYTFLASAPSFVVQRQGNPFAGAGTRGSHGSEHFPIEDVNDLTGSIGELGGPLGAMRNETVCVNADTTETQNSTKLAHAGWNLQRPKYRADGNGGFTVSYSFECLVAQGHQPGSDAYNDAI